MSLADALARVTQEAQNKPLVCRVCDFLNTCNTEDREAFHEYAVLAKQGHIQKVFLIQALESVGFEVGHSTLSRHLKHTEVVN